MTVIVGSILTALGSQLGILGLIVSAIAYNVIMQYKFMKSVNNRIHKLDIDRIQHNKIMVASLQVVLMKEMRKDVAANCITIERKKYILDMYEIYIEIGGNGVVNALYCSWNILPFVG